MDKKNLLHHVTKSLEKLQQQISGKGIAPNSGKNSANRPRSKVGSQSPLYGTHSLNNFIPQIVKLDFPRYEGRDDPTLWLCKADKYFRFYEIVQSDRVTLVSFYLEGEAQLCA